MTSKPRFPAAAGPKWQSATLVGLTALLLTGLFSTEMADPDSWWHLKTGEYIVTAHRLPVPDPFAFTTAAAAPGYPGEERTRRFNLTHEWLAQAAMYVVESAGGLGAVVLSRALLLAALCGFTGLVAGRRTGSLVWGIAAALMAAWLAVEFARDRPGILSYLFTAVFIAIMEDGRRLWVLPALAVVWANCHGGFFLGWVVMAAYCLDAWLGRAPGRRRMLAVSGVAVLASGLNPNGFQALATIVRYRSSALQSSLIEWSRADLWGPPYAFDILLYAGALALALSWKRVRPADWFLFAAFTAASLAAFRNEMLVGLFAPVLIAAYFPPKLRMPAAGRWAVAAALAVALAWGTARGSFFQLRAAQWRFPAGAADFLGAHGVTAPLFNTYESGGYLIWRGVPVFIDGRALSETLFQDYRRILGAPPGDEERNRLLARYGIGAIVLNAFEYNSGVLYPLAIDLAGPTQSAWKLVYNDAAAMVFLRDVPAGVSVLDKRVIADHFEAECGLHVEREPELSMCARRLGDFFLRAGERERARRALALYMGHPYAGDADARRAYLDLLRQ